LLGIDGYLLIVELILSLGCSVLGVNLPSADPHLLLLLIGLLLLEENPCTWLWCGGPHRDHRDC
jgi:hypothetical protein